MGFSEDCTYTVKAVCRTMSWERDWNYYAAVATISIVYYMQSCTTVDDVREDISELKK